MPICRIRNPSIRSLIDHAFFGQFSGHNSEVPRAICLVIELSLDNKHGAIPFGYLTTKTLPWVLYKIKNNWVGGIRNGEEMKTGHRLTLTLNEVTTNEIPT